jgi:hypothetical protein
MIEGSGSGSIALTNGSRRPKNMWIRWIRIRIRFTEQVFNLPQPLILVPDIPDSFYEILLKSFIMYGDTADVTKFNESYQKESSRN